MHYLDETFIAIGIPTKPDHMANSITVATAVGWESVYNASLILEPSPSPEEGRDKIMAKISYMQPRPTHVLFIDADVTVRRNTLKTLLLHDKEIVCGVVPVFQNGWRWNVSRQDETLLTRDELPTNPFKVDWCGFGVVLVRTSVFDVVDWPWWENQYKPGLRTVGEDIYFCRKVREAGFDIWCDPKVKCDHVRTGSFLKMMKG